MLSILFFYLLFSTTLIASVLGAPRPQLEYPESDTSLFGPYHGPHTASASASASNTAEPTTTFAEPTTTYAAATTTHPSNVPTTTDEGGQFYAQTTMPSVVSGSGAARTTAQRAGPTGITTGKGECPAGTTGTPQCYRYASDFPPESSWISLSCLVSHGRADMVTFSKDGPDEADDVIDAVQAVAAEAGIDPRIAFAVMLQESSGKVRPIIGDYGKSYGLFQVQASGVPLCTSYPVNQCPASVIRTQVEFGIYGHAGTNAAPQAPGIAYWLGAEEGNVGRAVRGYNTGSVPDADDLTNASGTRSYASDIANRLVGGLLGAQHQYTCPDF